MVVVVVSEDEVVVVVVSEDEAVVVVVVASVLVVVVLPLDRLTRKQATVANRSKTQEYFMLLCGN